MQTQEIMHYPVLPNGRLQWGQVAKEDNFAAVREDDDFEMHHLPSKSPMKLGKAFSEAARDVNNPLGDHTMLQDGGAGSNTS